MPVLALDTSGPVQSVAVASGGVPFTRSMAAAPHAHSVRLIEAIDAVLGEAGFPLSGMTGIVVTSGPGAFTGLRVGMATAKGLALGARRPLFGRSTLDVIATAIASIAPVAPGDEIFALAAAGRSKLYHARYRVRAASAAGAGVDRIGEETLGDVSGAAACASGTAFVGGALSESTRAALEPLIPERARWVAGLPPLAATLALLVERRAPLGEIAPGLVPNYVREPDAALPRRP